VAADNELAVVVRAIVDDFIGGMNRAKTEVKDFGATATAEFEKVEGASENLSHVWKSLFEAFIGVEIINGLKKIADLADDASNRLESAAQSAKNFGKAFNADDMESWLEKFARSAQGGGYAINDMRDAVQRFTAVGLDGAQVERALADTANLAASRHMDFAQAAQIVSYALTGHVEMLTRYGIISREAAKSIHTVEDAMRALEHATSGEAAKRADELAGAFGRLGTSITLLGEKFGQALIPYFDAAANALTNLANAFANLPDWLQKAAAGVTFVSLALMSLGLLLPAVVKAVAFLGNGFSILASAGRVAWSALSTLGSLIAGTLVPAFTGLISYVAQAVTAIGVDLVGADAAAAGSFAAMASPIIAVAAAIAGLVAAAVLLSGHWNDVMHHMSVAWDEFYNNILTKAQTLGKILGGQAAAMQALQRGDIAGYLRAEQQVHNSITGAMPQTTHWIDESASNVGSAIVDAAKQAWSAITGFFSGHSGNVSVPSAQFGGVIPGGGHGGRSGSRRGRSSARRTPDGHGEATIYFDDSDAVDTITTAMTDQRDALTRSLEDLRHEGAMAQAQGKMTPQLQAQLADREAKVREEIAAIEESIAQRKLEIAQFDYATDHSKKNLDAITVAAGAFQKAVDAATQATNRRIEADAAAARASQKHGGGTILDQLLQRAGIPLTASGSLNWSAVLMEAVQRSKSFADVMKVVNELMNVFAQIIDAFRPVIDLLLKGVIFVANGFIALWNVIASILNLFGLHVQKLKQLSYDVQDAATPFLKIVHDIPTLNELASGNIGPLYAAGQHDYIYNNITDPLVNQMQDPSLGGGLLGKLIEIIAVLEGIKILMGLFGGGGGGLFGGLSHIFSFGGKSGLSGLEAALGGIHLGGATLGSALLAVAGGAILGRVAGQLFGGGSHDTWGEIGGALGGGLGATLGMFGLAAGPLGALAGAALGSILGGIFGHKDNPAQMPDKYNTQSWGQDNANLWGATSSNPMNANGQQFVMDPQLAQMTGGKGLLQWLGQYIQQTGGKGLTPQQIAEFQGENVAVPIPDGKNGILDLANGLQVQWQQLYNDATAAFQKVFDGVGQMASQTGQNIASVASNVVRYVDASTNDLANSAQQTVAQQTQATQQLLATVSSTLERVAPAGSNVRTQPIAGVTLHNYGDINNVGDLEDVGQQIALAQMRAQRIFAYRLDRAGYY